MHLQVFFLVKNGSDWLVYCLNKVNERIDYLICSSNEKPMNAAELCKPLLQEVNFGHRRIFTFMDWPLAPVSFKEKISSSDAGLLAMYFMETYNGKQFSLEFEDIKVSVSPFFNLLINGLLLLINGLFFIISLLFYFQTWSQSYRKIIFERLFNMRGNGSTKKSFLLPKARDLQNDI